MKIVLDLKPEALNALKKSFKEVMYGDLTEDAMHKFIVHNINLSLQDDESEWYDAFNIEDFFVDLDYEPVWTD